MNGTPRLSRANAAFASAAPSATMGSPTSTPPPPTSTATPAPTGTPVWLLNRGNGQYVTYDPTTNVARFTAAPDPTADVPVIVLGEPQADAVDRVRAFARGCDDFVPRPFHYDELVARIRAVLRRTAPATDDVLEAGPIRVDRPTRRVTVGGRAVTLPAKEYELLLALAGDPHRVFTKEELLRDVWGFRSLGRTRTLDSHASRLRRKLAGQALPS